MYNKILNIEMWPLIIYFSLLFCYNRSCLEMLVIFLYFLKNEHYNSLIHIFRRNISWNTKQKQMIQFDIEDNKVRNVAFTGGCNGNLQGISHLVEGMDVNEAISRLEGIRCGFKSTSCPDQLAHALKEAIAK